MIVTTHRIGDIVFRTESEIELSLFGRGSFEIFECDAPEADVVHSFSAIASSEIDGASPTLDEQALIERCGRLRSLRRGCLILPPLLTEGSTPPQLDRHERRKTLEIGLLRAPTVWAALRRCLDSPEQVMLDLHEFSVVVRDGGRCTAQVFFPQDRAAIFREEYIQEGIRRLFATFMPSFASFMVHSSVVIRNGVAAVFQAPDGGGKSTVTELAEGSPLLSDDQNILRRSNGSVLAFGTPWGRTTRAGPDIFPFC